MKRQKLGVRRLAVGLAAVVVGMTGMLFQATPAAAAGGCNTGWRQAAWTTQQSYTYQPGTWCIQGSASTWTTVNFQSDGNLVFYSASEPLWASNTWGKGATRLVFQTDGNIVIYAGTRVLWASGQGVNRNASTQFKFAGNLIDNYPRYVYQLSHWQTSPSATLMDKRFTR